MQSTSMIATFSLKALHGISGNSSHLASRPLLGRCMQPQRRTMLRCLQLQVPEHSVAQARHDPPLDVVDSRLSGNTSFCPSIWGDSFLHVSDNPEGGSDEHQIWMERLDELKEEVRNIISSSAACSLPERLHLIDALERLCLDHLFEEEINVALTQFTTADVSDCELRTVALWFYLLRKHGYMVSPDVFMRFKDEGGFLTHGPIDLLNLYNAASLRTHGEAILDEAALFTRRSLEMKMRYMKGSLAHEIKCALEIPLPRRVTIYDSKYYISTCEKEATVHETILELAKLNYNIMQLHYRRELKIVTRWWTKDLQIESKLPFVRDRIVECYLWMLGVYFQPCYSRGRIILTMVLSIITTLDDMFDSYGTADECDIFAKLIERWDLKEDHGLPECMRFAFEKILNSYEMIEHELAQEEKYRMSYLRHFTLDLIRGYNVEVKMREASYVPESVEEHLQVSSRTGACHFLSCASFVGMGDIATKDCFDWVSSMPKMVQALCTILRLLDDLQTYEREHMAPHVAATIDSYMKQHNVSLETAREKIHELKEETWKDFNGEWLNANKQPKQIVERIFNLTRTMEFFYNQDDNFTNCHNLKETIRSLFLEPFTVC